METLNLQADSKAGKYAELLPQLEMLIAGETDWIANLANVAAALKEAFGFWWVGFYRVLPDADGGERLVLGPFQGPIACTSIARGRGVCGTAWTENRTLVVPDVDAFPGHIACSSASRSEIVVPLRDPHCPGRVLGVLDIDSAELDTFDETDAENLEKLAELICKSVK